MCVAIYSPIGTKVPSKGYLQNCWDSNPDGAGFAFNTDGRVRILKGFMTWTAFWSTFEKFSKKYDFTNKGVLMHFRIATHGGTNEECTHPFPLVSDIGIMQKTDIFTDYAVEHNGIISLTSSEASKPGVKASDTMKFIELYMSKIATNKDWFNNPANWELIYDLACSKIACLNSDGIIKCTAGFTEADDGNFYSNTSYKPYIPSKYYFSKYASYYDDDYDPKSTAKTYEDYDEELAEEMFEHHYYGSDSEYDYFEYGCMRRSDGHYEFYDDGKRTNAEKKAAKKEEEKVTKEYYPKLKASKKSEDNVEKFISDDKVDCDEWGEIPPLEEIEIGHEPVMLIGPQYCCVSATDANQLYFWDNRFPMIVDSNERMYFVDNSDIILDGNKMDAAALYVDNVIVINVSDVGKDNITPIEFTPNVQIIAENLYIA